MLDEHIRGYISANAQRFLDELKELIAIPSISALPEHAADVRRAAEWLTAHIQERIGLRTTLIETSGHPLVYGEWLGASGKPTVLIYGHYDVQPVDPIALWRTPPFEPTVAGDYLYGRGAVDDKGPAFAILKALETLCTVEGGLPLNVKVVLEGEEELGGPSIAAYVQANPRQLAADCVLILDTGMAARGVPTITYGLRGIITFEIAARGAAHDLHSGLYGGVAPNPIQALCWVLADLKGRDGRINLPGLYEMLRPVGNDERQIFQAQSAEQEQRLQAGSGLRELVGEPGYTSVERGTARPTFEVHGIRGGFTGEGSKTVIPAEATAKCSMRLVADQPQHAVLELVRQRVAALAPPGVTLEVIEGHGSDPVTVPLDSPAMRAAAAALEDEFARPVAFIRSGGSIGIAAELYTVLQQPIVMMGFCLAEDNMHAPNEQIYLPNFYAAIRSVAGFLKNLAP